MSAEPELPLWRVRITAESEYIQDVRARTAADAGVTVGDMVRARQIEPIVTGLSKIDIKRKDRSHAAPAAD
jgi:hypothetical protein